MSEPNGQLDAIIAAIRALDTKVENYSINLRNESSTCAKSSLPTANT